MPHELEQALSEGLIAPETLENRLRRKVEEIINEVVPGMKTIQSADAHAIRVQIEQVLAGVPEKKRISVIHKVRRMLDQEDKEVREKRIALTSRKAHLEHAALAARSLETWFSSEHKLQKPIGTMVHDFRDALQEGRIIDLCAKDAKVPAADVASWDDLAVNASVFMVNHDWGAAFQNAQDYVGGEINLPDEVCAFEFRINDRHVIAFAGCLDGVMYVQHAIQVKKGWMLLSLENEKNPGDFKALTDVTAAQIKAIAVALDAEVAETEVVRAPHRMNHVREREGKTPIFSYHVINLSRRTRVAPLHERSSYEASQHHRRLHFRRGHWRHYEDHKTWIKWMLVGNPDLGFVDKEYHL